MVVIGHVVGWDIVNAAGGQWFMPLYGLLPPALSCRLVAYGRLLPGGESRNGVNRSRLTCRL